MVKRTAAKIIMTIFYLGFGTIANAASCAVPADQNRIAAEVGQYLNAHRKANGLPRLKFDRKVSRSAQKHACDMSVKGYFSHYGQDGSKPKLRLHRTGCKAGRVAENIAVGQKGAQEVVQGWMTSPGHRKNMLMQRGIDRFGIGIADSGNAYSHGNVWVLVLSSKCR